MLLLSKTDHLLLWGCILLERSNQTPQMRLAIVGLALALRPDVARGLASSATARSRAPSWVPRAVPILDSAARHVVFDDGLVAPGTLGGGSRPRGPEGLRRGARKGLAPVAHAGNLDHGYGHDGTPGSNCPQPEPNATELPSCARISARAAKR